MKISVKKVYCHKCQRLVKGLEQRTKDSIRIVCSRCDALIWTWDGSGWRHELKVT